MSSVLGPGGKPLPVPLGGPAVPEQHATDVIPASGRRGSTNLDRRDAGLLPADLAAARLSTNLPQLGRLSQSLQNLPKSDAVQPRGPGGAPASLVRSAAHAASQPLPTAQQMRAHAQLGGREKGNLFFGAWKRSTPYKNVLAQATAYHETLAQIQAQPLQSEALATRLQELNAQLDRLRQSVQSYVDSPSQRLTRKPAMQALLTRIEAETRALAGLQAGAQPGGLPPNGLSFEKALELSRAGVQPDDFAWADGLGLEPAVLGRALQLGLADDAIALLAQFPSHATPEMVRDWSSQGFSLEHMRFFCELGYDADVTRGVNAFQDPDTFAERKADLENARQMLAQRIDSAGKMSLSSAFEFLRICDKRNIPTAFAMHCGAQGMGFNDTIQLHQAQVPPDRVTEGVRAGLSGVQIAFAHANGFDFVQVQGLVQIGLSFADIRQALTPPPDPQALAAWTAAHPQISPSMAALLAKAGPPLGALTNEDLMALIALGASVSQIAAIGNRPPSDADLRPYLQTRSHPPITRVEAMLLKAAELPVDAAALYRKHAEQRDLAITVSGPTTQSSVRPQDQIGAPVPLGRGALNQVYTVRYQAQGAQQATEKVFKPIQPKRTGGASQVLGIDSALPRYEMRNVACSRIDALLGFGVIPKTEIGVVRQADNRYQIGILMERVGGMTGYAEIKQRVDVTDTHLGREFAIAVQRPGGRKIIDDYCRRHGNAKVEIQDGRFYLTKGEIAAEVLPQDIEYQRQLVSLQLFDALVGQGDRHNQNWMRVADRQGNTVRIVGIDNDQSLGRRPDDPEDLRKSSDIDPFGALRGIGLPPVVDRQHYDAIMSLSPEQLRGATAGLITDAEQNAMVRRLRTIQGHLIRLERNREVVNPAGWGQQTLNRLAAPLPAGHEFEGEVQSYLGRIVPKQNDGRLLKFPPELIA